MKKMNLPNKLTLLRIILVPAVIAAILIEFPYHFLIAGLLFGAAAITDALDGNYSALCTTSRQQALDLKAQLEK